MNFPWKNKKVLIAGLGLLGGGVGVAKFFAEAGAKVTVTDLKPTTELKSSLFQLKNFNIRYALGGHREKDFKDHDLIIKNPAIPANSLYLQIAKRAKVPIEMEASIFFLLTPSKNIIGVTGTKGKTTTTLLIGRILTQANYDTVVAGTPQSPILAQLEKVKPQSRIVLELSSWQLESLAPHKISPQIAVLTNIFPDHLNRYKNFKDYIQAKKNIFKFQSKKDFFITSSELELTKELANEAKSMVVFFSKDTLPQNIARHVKLPGAHNLLNISAAYKVSKILGISDELIISALKNFRTIPNHLEVIGKFNGISFINDTTSTIPQASIAAISTIPLPAILICGGADKELDFGSLCKVINTKVKAVVLLEGTATDKIEKEVEKEKIIGRFSNFKKAIKAAFKFAKPGDTVLLSPATASFGMFKNEFDRGEQFKKIVKSL